MKKLVLAEKPSVARDIARVLGCNKKGNGYLEGNKYVVTWALGHLVTLADPEQYDDKYKKWDMEQLPLIPKNFKLSVIPNTRKQFNAVKEQLFRKDIDEIIIATDAGREGELVARWILVKTGCKKPLKRLWISSVTDKAIRDGFNNLKDGRSYDNLYHSAVARAEGDWVVGINASRALTCHYNTSLSAGRVQTPTLSIIATREEEIRNFKAKKYYGATITYKGTKFTWQNKSNKDTKTFNEKDIDSVIEKINKGIFKIKSINKVEKKSYSPLLYDLTELQRDCNKIFGFSPKETLNILQKLYETHKFVTYPRTDSRYLTDDMVSTLKDRVKAVSVGPYSKVATSILRKNIKANKSFVDSSKVSDHHAIIPTEEPASLSSLNDKERKVFDLIVKRFLAVLMEPCKYEEMSVEGEIAGEIFRTKGKKIISLGYKEVFSAEEEENSISVDFSEGMEIKNFTVSKTTGETKPPALFNEATLLSAMENPAKYMDNNDEKLKKTLGETGGLGTVATRADIIDKLFNSFLIEKRGKDIYITSKGKQLLNLVPKELKSPELTAKWEMALSNIAKGKSKKDIFINDMKNYSKTIVSEIKNSEAKFIHDNLSGERCPECGKKMLEVNGKKGKMLVCQDRECGYRKSISVITNARCPECKKKLELRGKGDGAIYVCPGSNCHFREKASQFKKRFDKSGKVDKREINNYMKKLKQEEKETANNPFADLLKDFK